MGLYAVMDFVAADAVGGEIEIRDADDDIVGRVRVLVAEYPAAGRGVARRIGAGPLLLLGCGAGLQDGGQGHEKNVACTTRTHILSSHVQEAPIGSRSASGPVSGRQVPYARHDPDNFDLEGR